MTTALTDARALLQLLAKSTWQEIHVRTADAEIYIAKPGAMPNPMRAAPAPAAQVEVAAPSASPHSVTAVNAPHVGTLVSLLPIGTSVTQGECVGQICVLDEHIDLVSNADGTITAVLVETGVLVEFETPLLHISA